MNNAQIAEVFELDQMRFGVAMARRGWCEANHIVNTRPMEEFLRFLHRNV